VCQSTAAKASNVLYELAYISVSDSGRISWHFIAQADRGATIFHRAEQDLIGNLVHRGAVFEGARPSVQSSDLGTVALSRQSVTAGAQGHVDELRPRCFLSARQIRVRRDKQHRDNERDD
jgi:hypothetical protein